MEEQMKLASRVFRFAGVYGLLVLAPQYFTEGELGADYPPAITHPEFYYGFLVSSGGCSGLP